MALLISTGDVALQNGTVDTYSMALKIPTGFVVVENSAVYHNLGRCGRELHSRSLLGT